MFGKFYEVCDRIINSVKLTKKQKVQHTPRNLRKVIKVSPYVIDRYGREGNLDALSFYYMIRGRLVKPVIYNWTKAHISHITGISFYNINILLPKMIRLGLLKVRGKNMHLIGHRRLEDTVVGDKKYRMVSTTLTYDITSLKSMEDALRLKLIEIHGARMHHVKTTKSLSKIQHKAGLRVRSLDVLTSDESQGQIENGCEAIRMSASIVKRVAHCTNEVSAHRLLRRLEERKRIVCIRGTRRSMPISKKGWSSSRDYVGGYYYKGRHVSVEASFIHFVHHPIRVADNKAIKSLHRLFNNARTGGATQVRKALSTLDEIRRGCLSSMQKDNLSNKAREIASTTVDRIAYFLRTFNGGTIVEQGNKQGTLDDDANGPVLKFKNKKPLKTKLGRSNDLVSGLKLENQTFGCKVAFR